MNLGRVKTTGILAILIALAARGGADPASKLSGSAGTGPAVVAEPEPSYREESPLPEGWPAPGPYGQVTRKQYPASRAAFTTGSRPNGGFWKLFKHIEGNGIPMTAPVEMNIDPADTTSSKMTAMAFLYQSPRVGNTGPAGKDVEVRDVPAVEVLSYTWQGGRSGGETARARTALDAELARLGLTARGYRLLGYNSPFIPRSKQTHELQAILESAK